MMRSQRKLAVKESRKDKEPSNINNREVREYSAFNEDELSVGPSPLDFENFLPWAVTRLCLIIHVNIERAEAEKNSFKAARLRKVGQSEMSKSRNVSESSKTEVRIAQRKDSSEFHKNKDEEEIGEKLNEIPITATYSGENVTKLTFSKCDRIPRVVMKVLGLIIKFHPQLTTIVISKGLTINVVSDIVAMLHGQCNLSSLCFNGCILPALPLGNYHTLLDPVSQLTELSLARCAIGDDMLKLISERLVYPLPASKTLAILTLSSNNITDVGAEALGQCLRSNRTLKYINLADNQITNKGLAAILAPLLKFKLSQEEIFTFGELYVTYMKKKTEIINDFLSIPTSSTGITVYMAKRKHSQKGPKLNEKEEMYKQAELFATETLGEFIHPFNPSQCKTVNGQQFCYGNSSLCYLNISFNKFDIFGLQKILEVLYYQNKDLSTGIINLRLDGNPLPISCKEIMYINNILEYKLTNLTKSKPAKKKG